MTQALTVYRQGCLPPKHQNARFDETFWRRFWSKVAFSADGCWLWTASLGGPGYGQISTKIEGEYRPSTSHRLAAEYFTGLIPDGMQALHGCDCKPCCRFGEGHIYVGTPADNIRDSIERGQWYCEPRKAQCLRGHTYSIYKGRQVCWICRRIKETERRARLNMEAKA